jgi:putative cell wall-binding protein
MEPSKYGVEVLLNDLLKDKKTARVFLHQLNHIEKFKKYDPITTLRNYIKEGAEIALELSKREIIISSDIKILVKLENEMNLKETRRLITLLKNNKIKSFLNKYFEKYFSLSKH